jgi:DNA repair protein RadC
MIARKQIKRHGSLSAVLASSRQTASPDAVTAHLGTVQDALAVAARGTLSSAPIIGTSEHAALFLMVTMAGLSVEHLRVLFLNTKNRLIAEEDFGRGTIDQAPIFPREVIKRALEIGAASVIVAHNHPSGEPKPSRQDIAITKQLIAGGNALNIAVHDHFIIASSGWISLRAEGLI